MSSWYAWNLMAAAQIRERREEAERFRRAGAVLGHAGSSIPSSAGIPRRARPDSRGRGITRVAEAARRHRRCWTIRLAGLAVTVTVRTAVRRETGA
jgi:hypothetical protein